MRLNIERDINMRNKYVIWIISAVVLLAIGAGIVFRTKSSPPRYTLVELKGLAGASCQAHAINSRGQVVGVSIMARPECDLPIGKAVLWNEGKPRILGIPDPQIYRRLDINNRGQVVGYYRNPIGKIRERSFIYENGKFMELKKSRLVPRALNEVGDVLGDVEDGSAVLRNGKLRRFGSTHRYAHVMNDNGQFAVEDELRCVAFMWDSGKMRPLGELDERCDRYVPYSINNRGQVVGVAFGTPPQMQRGKIQMLIDRLLHQISLPPESRYAFISENGKMKHLDVEDARSVMINNHGEIAGTRDIGGDGTQPFIMLHGESRDLNALINRESGYTITSVWDINDRGEMIGMATRDGGECAILLSPISR